MRASESFGPVQLLRKLTIDQYRALWEDYAPDESVTEADRAKVMGLYVVVCFCLIFNNYLAIHMYELLPESWLETGMEVRFARRVCWALWVAIAYMGPTYLYCRTVLGLGLRDLGFRLKGFTKHVPLYLVFFFIVLPFVVGVSTDDHFLKTYPLSKHAGESWTWLAIWEASYAVQFVGVEFFFRGVLLFGAVRVLGPWVLPAMVVPYVMLHFQKPMLETSGAIIAGTVLGVVSLRTRSIFAGILIHTAVAWSMDALALYHKGDLTRLMGW